MTALLDVLLPVATVYWAMHTAVFGPIEVTPVPKKIYGNVANYDGDTLQLKVEDGTARLIFMARVAELDTPEVHGNCSEERRLADLAKRETSDFLTRGPVLLTYVAPVPEQYNRVLVSVAVRFPSGQLRDLADHLKSDPRGIARGFDLKIGRLPWC